jgi:uncharacterized protein YidB (DUF937 family)
LAPQLFSDRSEYVAWVAINDGVARLSRELPSAIDQYTPDGRITA